MRLIRPRNFDQRAKRAGLDESDLAEVIRTLLERPTFGPGFRAPAARARFA